MPSKTKTRNKLGTKHAEPDLRLPPRLEYLVRELERYADPDYDFYSEDMKRIEAEENENWLKLTVTLRDQFRAEDAERRRLWGSKFPRWKGERPPKPSKPPQTLSDKKPGGNGAGGEGKKGRVAKSEKGQKRARTNRSVG